MCRLVYFKYFLIKSLFWLVAGDVFDDVGGGGYVVYRNTYKVTAWLDTGILALPIQQVFSTDLVRILFTHFFFDSMFYCLKRLDPPGQSSLIVLSLIERAT